MAIESPLFQSSMELMGHSITHYNGKKELDRKLLILHLANAVELILKDLVLDSGESIYKNPKETITIQGCLSVLDKKNIKLPLLNKIELLVDERNALQHRFGSPNELTSIFYMNIAQSFFRGVLKDHYDQDYDEVITQFADDNDLVAFRMNEPTNDQELDKLQELAKIHPLGAVLAAWTYFEKSLEHFFSDVLKRKRRASSMELINGRLEVYGVLITEDLRNKLSEVRNIRNMATHGRIEPTEEQVKQTVQTIEELESYLSTLDKEYIKEKAEAEHERRKAEHQKQMEYIKEKELAGEITILDMFGEKNA